MYDSRDTAFIYASDYRGNLRTKRVSLLIVFLFFSAALIPLFPIEKDTLYMYFLYAHVCNVRQERICKSANAT